MNMITAEKDTQKKYVKFNPQLADEIDSINGYHASEDVWSRIEKKFNEHYGTDYKFGR